mgnify:CR=1 FL=1
MLHPPPLIYFSASLCFIVLGNLVSSCLYVFWHDAGPTYVEGERGYLKLLILREILRDCQEPLSGPTGHLSPRGEARQTEKGFPRDRREGKKKVDQWKWVQRHAGGRGQHSAAPHAAYGVRGCLNLQFHGRLYEIALAPPEGGAVSEAD